jgi:hypothetical protein
MGKTPTGEQFRAYEAAFDYFNRALFSGQLPPVMLNFSRKARSRGFYCTCAWQRKEESVPEISLNPDELDRPPREALSTLVHEMVHHWQQCFGKPSRAAYHNREWAEKMVAVGLQPSDTGLPGGKVVGQHMTHYIVEGGPFAVSFAAMPQHILLPWTSAGSLEEAKKKRTAKCKTPYTCDGCGAKVWGKPGLNIVCGDCDESFVEEPVDGDEEG